jgi:hypothetical protein
VHRVVTGVDQIVECSRVALVDFVYRLGLGGRPHIHPDVSLRREPHQRQGVQRATIEILRVPSRKLAERSAVLCIPLGLLSRTVELLKAR